MPVDSLIDNPRMQGQPQKEKDWMEELAQREAYNSDVRKFKFGEKDEREEFIKKYGYEDALDIINEMLNEHKNAKPGTGGHGYKLELEEYRDDLLSRQQS